MTLRNKVIDLVTVQRARLPFTEYVAQDIALAAARMALEDAAQACERRANDIAADNCYQESDTGATVWRNDYAMYEAEEADDCAAAIRALRDTI